MSYNRSAMSQSDEFPSTGTSEGSINVKSGIKLPEQEPARWFNGPLCLPVLHAWEFRRSQSSLSWGCAAGGSVGILQQDAHTGRERLLLL